MAEIMRNTMKFITSLFFMLILGFISQVGIAAAKAPTDKELRVFIEDVVKKSEVSQTDGEKILARFDKLVEKEKKTGPKPQLEKFRGDFNRFQTQITNQPKAKKKKDPPELSETLAKKLIITIESILNEKEKSAAFKRKMAFKRNKLTPTKLTPTKPTHGSTPQKSGHPLPIISPVAPSLPKQESAPTIPAGVQPQSSDTQTQAALPAEVTAAPPSPPTHTETVSTQSKAEAKPSAVSKAVPKIDPEHNSVTKPIQETHSSLGPWLQVLGVSTIAVSVFALVHHIYNKNKINKETKNAVANEVTAKTS